MPRTPLNDITQIRRKRERGEELTMDERTKLREYYGRYSKRKQGVHLKGEREKEWRALAREQGLPLSTWIQERVTQALQGHGETVRELRADNQRLRDEVAGLRGTSGNLAVENSKLQARIESMESSLMEAMEHAIKIDDGRP